jgi:hypothetical protein
MSTLSLTIDFSNGAQKHFSTIPWTKGLTILGAIEAIRAIPPGAAIQFGSDRTGRVLGLAIDGVPGEKTPPSEWTIWVNAKLFQGRLGTESSFHFHPEERDSNLVNPGDHVLIKLSLAPAEPA